VRVRANDILLSLPAEVVFAGRIAEVSDGYVVVVRAKGSQRWCRDGWLSRYSVTGRGPAAAFV